MNNVDKCYYTPEIQEFHIGFRYEYLDNGLWRKYVLSRDMHFEDPPCPDGFGYGRHHIDDFRVKCLDREDIEELGWQHVENGLFSKDVCALSWSHAEEEEANIMIYVQLSSIRITLFMGKIKNFNELQKLMKQLDILRLNST